MIKNKLSLQETHPQVADQWHPTKNGDRKPDQLTSGSNKPVWWQCDEGHEWEATVKNRLRGSDCKYCKSLAYLHPEIAKEWHPDKNGDRTPDQLTSGSNKKAWWKCDKGPDHEWEVTINNRVSGGRSGGTGCPYCSNKKVSVTNNLAVRYPEIAKQWHPDKNGELTPDGVVAGAAGKFWWKCDKEPDHEWQATCDERTRGYINCPVCKSLAYLHPEIAKEWHPDKNGDLTPDQLTSGSDKPVWWQCDKGPDHEWQTSPSHRTLGGTGCPYCSNREVSVTNNLAVRYPEIAKQWHPDKNDLTPDQVVFGAADKFWWQCDKGPDHEWQATIASRTSRGLGCRFCVNQQPSVTNNLAVRYPEIAKKWHPDKNGDLTPDQVVAGSHKKVWWKCDKGPDHEWRANPNSITESHKAGNSGCPYCISKKVSVTNNLAVRYPEIAKQWHPDKNDLTPDQVVAGSHSKVWWKCRHGHESRATIVSRAAGRNCPYCTLSGTSKIEIRVRFELKNFIDYDIYDNRLKTSEDKSYQVDIKVPSVKLIIEYDGAYHHSETKNKHFDIRKTRDLQKDGWKVIRIRAEELGSVTDDDVILTRRDADSPKIVMEHLLHKLALLRYVDMGVYEDYRKRDSLISDNEATAYIEKLSKPLKAFEINENQLNEQLLFEFD